MEKKLVKRNKFIPCTRKSNGIVIIMLDYQPIDSTMGWCLTHTFKNGESMEEIKKYVDTYINMITTNRIKEGLKINDKVVWLSTENQQNYKSAFDLAMQTDGESLPYIVKIGNDIDYEYITLSTMDEIENFYRKVYTHIQECIQEGWKMKDEIDWTPFK